MTTKPQSTTTKLEASEPTLEPCPWCKAVPVKTDLAPSQRYRLDHKPTCYLFGRMTDMRGSAHYIFIGLKEVEKWNARVSANGAPAVDRAVRSELIHIAAELARGDGFLSTCAEDMNPRLKRADILKTAERQEERLKDWACRVRQVADKLSRAASTVAPQQSKARYEKAHDARYQMTHPVHPDIVVLWFLALKSHWFDDPNNMFHGQREAAKAYLYKWVETGELADDNTTLEITTAMKFREWLASSWTAPAPSAAIQDESQPKHDLDPLEFWCDLAEVLGHPRPTKADVPGLVSEVKERLAAPTQSESSYSEGADDAARVARVLNKVEQSNLSSLARKAAEEVFEHYIEEAPNRAELIASIQAVIERCLSEGEA